MEEIVFVLTSRGLLTDDTILRSKMTPEDYKKMLRELTIINTFFIGNDKTNTVRANNYKYITVPKPNGGTKKLLAIPRFGLDWVEDIIPSHKVKVKHPKEIVKIPAWKFKKKPPAVGKLLTVKEELEVSPDDVPGIIPYGYQQAALDYLLEEIYDPDMLNSTNRARSSCNFIMDTGAGKTYLGGALIQELKVKTLVIAHNSRGASEWEKMLKNFPRIHVGHYYTKKKNDGDVVIMIINSAMRENFEFGKMKNKKVISRDKYFREFGLVIYDEVPEYVADQRRKLFWETNFPYALGLTATPDETTKKLDDVYKYHLGPLVYAEDIPGFDVGDISWNFTVRAIKYYGPPEYTKELKSDKTNMVVSAWMAKQFMKDPYRLQMFLNDLMKYYDEGKNIYVFSEMREILTDLKEIIKQRTHISASLEDEVDTVMGGASDAAVQRAEQNARVILTTYQYGSRGVSIVKMDCGFGLTPRKNGMRQVCGRITRKGGDTTLPRIWVDYIDQNTNKKSNYRTREEAYIDKGYTIKKEEIHWEDIEM